jgi:hypothetical protein
MRRVVEPNRLPQYARVAAELRLPEAVAQHDRPGAVVIGAGGVEDPPQQWTHTEER